MAENFFKDYPERTAQFTKACDLAAIAPALEEVRGDKDTFKNAEEAIEFYVGALDEIGRVAAAELAPNAATIDRTGTHFKNGKVELPEALVSNMHKLRDLGILSGQLPRKYEGFNLPKSAQMMALEMIGQACPNTGLTLANWSMVGFFEHWATEEQKARYLPKLLSLEWTSSMALTESGAGSDLGKLRTVGKKQGDHFLITGTKQFISGGDGEICFALVRTDPTSSGLNGLSVLLVHRHLEGKENFKVAKIEDKVCLHASATCELVFENSVGHLLGPEGEGFKVMLYLMNEARLAMSALATGIATAALGEAKKYAAQRVTMGKPILQHPMVADMIYEMEIEIRAMRALVMESAVAADWMEIYERRGDKKNFEKWKKRYRRLTPLAKYYCCEKAIQLAKNAVQIFGGYGVCREYPVERIWRETIIYPIYEGTSQIQSLMVLKDTLKDVAQQAGGFLGSLAGAWGQSLVTRDPVKSKLLEARNELNQGIKTILMSILKDKFKSEIESLKEQSIRDFLDDFSLQLLSPKTDLSFPFLVAERFTRITADYYALKCLADRISDGDTDRQHFTLEFAEIILPRMRMENTYMTKRLPSTLLYLKQLESAQS